jgi:hypothetical protein
LIELAIIDFFSPDQRMRRGEPPIDLDMDPKNDVGFFGAVSDCDSTRTNGYNFVTLGLGLPSYEHGVRAFP